MTALATPAHSFVVTRGHRRFAEFAEAVRSNRYVGLCHGAPGVGKTLSAREHTRWPVIEELVTGQRRAALDQRGQHPDAHALLYTAPVAITPVRLDQEVAALSQALDALAGAPAYRWQRPRGCGSQTQLLIVDEADRLNTNCLEMLRDRFDHSSMGLILIGMPGIERRLARYPQLYSRVGFVHRYDTLRPEELAGVIEQCWPDVPLESAGREQVLAAIQRCTHGNFRLVERLLSQVRRVLAINQLPAVTEDVVQAAREALVFGT
ncbi:MAG: AAA family ATPase [Solirubrobacteraceae bacterium]